MNEKQDKYCFAKFPSSFEIDSAAIALIFKEHENYNETSTLLYTNYLIITDGFLGTRVELENIAVEKKTNI